MKLAEALLLRAEYQKKITYLQSRVLSNIKVQENDEPLENPQKLIDETLELTEQLCVLIKRINACNNKATLPNGLTISEAIVERETLLKKQNLLTVITTAAQTKDFRLTRTELKMRTIVSMEELQKQIDALSQRYRILDTEIQSANWITEME
ncbi:MAG: DIP1984 family protein [Methanomassiliicoccaceae archaeon]|jgi:hypothetical protein|nr:DIP1984 family protein [Methanomassiliicoccaceae archaeon]